MTYAMPGEDHSTCQGFFTISCGLHFVWVNSSALSSLSLSSRLTSCYNSILYWTWFTSLNAVHWIRYLNVVACIIQCLVLCTCSPSRRLLYQYIYIYTALYCWQQQPQPTNRVYIIPQIYWRRPSSLSFSHGWCCTCTLVHFRFIIFSCFSSCCRSEEWHLTILYLLLLASLVCAPKSNWFHLNN